MADPSLARQERGRACCTSQRARASDHPGACFATSACCEGWNGERPRAHHDGDDLRLGFSWDANTVTHILGVRAFGTQLLCDQVVGRALRRQSYELDADGLFPVEYADILGIPFDFAAKPVVAKPMTPKPTTRVRATKDREALEIAFPRVEGERLRAEFSDDSRLVLTPEEVGPCTVLMEGIVGEGVERTAAELDAIRPSTIVFGVAKKGTQIRKMPLCSSRIG